MFGWLRRRELIDRSKRVCQRCDHYQAGHYDARVNWVMCAREHRLFPEEAYVSEYRPDDDPDGTPMRVTSAGWTGGGGAGEPMLGRTDCPDWKSQRFRLNLGDPQRD